jgi:prevent-host-death family protein
MIKRITAMKARQNFGQIMNEVSIRNDRFIIERNGKPLAALVPIWMIKEEFSDISLVQTNPNDLKDSKKSGSKVKSAMYDSTDSIVLELPTKSVSGDLD